LHKMPTAQADITKFRSFPCGYLSKLPQA
jgi:hypothetical protein